MAQINTLVGDWVGNREKVLTVCRETAAMNPEAVVVFPELTLTGYPPEDLLLRPSIGEQTDSTLAELCASLPPTLHVIVGYPRLAPGGLFNAAGVIHQGAIVAEYFKQCLPNYQVFDEKR